MTDAAWALLAIVVVIVPIALAGLGIECLARARRRGERHQGGSAGKRNILDRHDE
jgi:hypothetical protein